MSTGITFSLIFVFASTHRVASYSTPICSGGWWCASDNLLGQSLTSAIATDSCVCHILSKSTQTQAIQQCASFGGYLADVRNTLENSAIQQIINLAAQQYTPTDQCLGGWTLFNGKCYKVFDKQLKFQDAENLCTSNHAHLVSIHNGAEFTFLNGLALSSGVSMSFWGYWIGATKSGSSYVYTDGTPYDYSLPVGLCSTLNYLMNTFYPNNYIGVRQDFACAHQHTDDYLNVACKMEVQTWFPSWIGLQSTNTYAWNRGCEVIKSSFNAVGTPTTLSSANYVYQNQIWNAVSLTDVASSIICRKDRNPCGTNNCTAAQTCTNVGNCFSCSSQPITSSSISTSSSTTTSTLPAIQGSFDQMTCGEALMRNAGVVESTDSSISLGSCALKCNSLSSCVAFNYNNITSTCEYLTQTSATQPFICDENWNYFQRV